MSLGSSPDDGPGSDNGNTPLDDDETEGLIADHVSTRADLNAWEVLNISRAEEWLSRRRKFDVLDVRCLRELHKQMFGDTWEWAGVYRKSDKNISGHHWSEVPVLMNDLVENTRAQYEASGKTPKELDEIAMRFHHRLVQIHPWPNGNGRHARLATDQMLKQWGQTPFGWGGADSVAIGTSRRAYIRALQRADAGEFDLLRVFVRS